MKLTFNFNEEEIDRLLMMEEMCQAHGGPFLPGFSYLPAAMLAVLKACCPDKCKRRKIPFVQALRAAKRQPLPPFSFDADA